MDNCRVTPSGMPKWLLTDEHYLPQSGKDTFVGKSILALLNILARIRTQDSQQAGKHPVNAVFKIACTFLLVTLLSISRSFILVIILIVYLLAAISLMEAQTIVKILKVSLMMAFFTFVVTLPAAFGGNGFSCVMITAKVFATITAVNILSHSTKWSAITSSLKRFFVPDIFILVLDITIKYIVMLGEFALNMLYALKLRSVGRNNNKYASLSGIAGTLFIKSKEMAEDTYNAMECRGFTGEYRVYDTFRFTIADFGYILIHIGIVALFLYFGKF